MTKGDHPTAAAAATTPSNAPHQSSAKLYKVLIIITIFGVMTFIMALMTDSDGHMDEEHVRKELILKQFLETKAGVATHKRGKSKDKSKSDTKESSIRRVDKPQSTTPQKKAAVQTDPQVEKEIADAKNAGRPPYHVVFSTSCNDQQHWESYVFFYHANKVNQQGTVTRILSGCKKAEAKWIREFHDNYIATMSPNFHLHMTADFSQLTKFQQLGDKNGYKYMNKPYGLRDWMESVFKMDKPGRSPEVEDGIVFLMDPDNILLRPIVHDFSNEDMIFVKDQPDWKVVEHGRPMAQQDGYLGNQWMGLNISYVTHGGDIDGIKDKDGPQYWNTGPPYLATVRDMYNIAVLWTEYAPRVYHIHPKLFAEMYGFIIATTQLNLKHTLIKSIVVSTTGSPSREGWPFVDALPDDEVCDPRPDAPLPMGLHYCKRYMLGPWFFSKYRLKKKYISCESPLLILPPKNLVNLHYNYSLQPPPHGHKGEWDPPRADLSDKQAKREAFMLCGLIRLINEAAIHFKTTACNGTANMATNYTFFADPNH